MYHPSGAGQLRPLVVRRAYGHVISETTAQAVDEAERDVGKARALAKERETDCLCVIADGLAAAVDQLAKRTALAQTEVTKGLGTEGVQKLKGELHAQAAILAADIGSSQERIDWPTSATVVRPQDVHSALFKYLYGPRVNAFAVILKKHGFGIQDDNAQRSQSLVLPQSLYDQNSFDSLAEALTTLGKAEDALRRAQAEHDRDAVENLWGTD